MPVTLVFSHTASQICSIRLARMFDQVAIGAGQQAAGHLDDGDLAAERGVDGAQLEADVAAADDEQRLRDVGQIERAGGIHQPRAVDRQAGNLRRHRAGGDDAVLEGERLLRAVDLLDVERVRVAERGHALDVLDLAQVADLAGAGGELADDLVLEVAQLVEIDRRLGELDAEVFGVGRLGDHVGDVQQRLRRDAAAVDADAAGVLFRIDQA